MRSGPPPPLRFLMVVLGGWVAVRAAMLVPAWVGAPPAVMVSLPPERSRPARFEPVRGVARVTVALPPPARAIQSERAGPMARIFTQSAPPANIAQGSTPLPFPPARAAEPNPPFFTVPPAPPRPSRLAVSAWLFVREGRGGQLAAGGTLGGSQAGARLTYRLNDDAARPLALSARAYAPLDRIRDGEVALGLEWKPLARLPVRLLAERREALGRGGRSAFALLGHGGSASGRCSARFGSTPMARPEWSVCMTAICSPMARSE